MTSGEICLGYTSLKSGEVDRSSFPKRGLRTEIWGELAASCRESNCVSSTRISRGTGTPKVEGSNSEHGRGCEQLRGQCGCNHWRQWVCSTFRRGTSEIQNREKLPKSSRCGSKITGLRCRERCKLGAAGGIYSRPREESSEFGDRVAEREGFEPPEPLGSPDFESGRLNQTPEPLRDRRASMFAPSQSS